MSTSKELSEIRARLAEVCSEVNALTPEVVDDWIFGGYEVEWHGVYRKFDWEFDHAAIVNYDFLSESGVRIVWSGGSQTVTVVHKGSGLSELVEAPALVEVLLERSIRVFGPL